MLKSCALKINKLSVICVLAGIVSGQTGILPASAATLSGTFGFRLDASEDGPLSFVGPSLAEATKVTFSTVTSSPDVQNRVSAYLGRSFNGKDNDFNALSHPSPFALPLGSIVTLNTNFSSLTVQNLNNASYTSNFMAQFLTFSGTGGGASINRFSYDIYSIKWMSNASLTSDHLNFSSIGEIHDALHVFDDFDALLKFAAVDACDPFADCVNDKNANMTWTFSTTGTGGSSLIGEPATKVLFGFGLLALGIVRRRT